jgi:hypothetical protein
MALGAGWVVVTVAAIGYPRRRVGCPLILQAILYAILLSDQPKYESMQ